MQREAEVALCGLLRLPVLRLLAGPFMLYAVLGY